jgi:Na+-transporting NADH:ubiquinone oxidoreductase subunit NqrF
MVADTDASDLLIAFLSTDTKVPGLCGGQTSCKNKVQY